MIRAVIIDDVKESRQTLADDVARYCPDIKVVGFAENVNEGILLIEQQKPALIFLDVHLGDDTGFSILEKVQHKNFKVIFTTGSDRFAIQAIKFSALDYLLKPVDPDDLIAAVNKLRSNEAVTEHLNLLLDNLKNRSKAPKRVILNSADRVHVVNIDEIIRCESQGSYTLFYLQNKKEILVTRTLKEFEEMFDPEEFVRVHHSHLININYLKEYVKTDGGYAVMADKSQVPVSVRKKDSLLKLLNG
jgi:two-component system LytT family response regulator